MSAIWFSGCYLKHPSKAISFLAINYSRTAFSGFYIPGSIIQLQQHSRAIQFLTGFSSSDLGPLLHLGRSDAPLQQCSRSTTAPWTIGRPSPAVFSVHYCTFDSRPTTALLKQCPWPTLVLQQSCWIRTP